MGHLKRLRPYFARYRWQLVGGISSVFGASVVGLAAPLLIGAAVDSLRQSVAPRALLNYGGLLVAVTLIQGLFSFAQRRLLVAMSRDIEFDLRSDYFGHLQTLPLSFYRESYTGDLMARATNDLQAVRMICGPAIMYSANTLFTAFGALFLMARIHVGLSLVALCALPLVVVVMRIFGQRIHILFQKVQSRFSDLSTRVQENLAGARVVRAYAVEEEEKDRFEGLNREYVERNRMLVRWSAAFHPLLQVLIGLGFVAVLWYGGSLVARGGITVGEFVAFNFFLGKLIWPMIAIGWVINLVQRGLASLGRILEILDTRAEINDAADAVAPAELRGEVRFRTLEFAYRPGEPVLREIDLLVPAGSTLAIVGRTGSGKSTLLSLLPRLLEPPADTLTIDGIDVRQMRLAALRAAIGVVPQESILFSVTVAENIAFGRPGASREEVSEAARIAGLEEDLEQLPQGLETLVGERGVTLSGGQRQRVALARAVLRRPRILLLDDCLSAVDTQTEETILENLGTVFEGRTVLLVAHRVSTVRQADQIVVLEGGRIVERGDHQELLAAGGAYAELARLQQLEEELAAAGAGHW
jgi:ATP-binding cassette subfamily B protein